MHETIEMKPAIATPTMSDAARWRAVLARSHAHDGAFVYAVRSTGVYCRPSCPSRRPRRDRVAFYATPDAAARAGFRACRRCRPNAPANDDRRIALVQRHLEAHLDERVTLAELAVVAGTSPFHLHRRFRDVVGLTPRAWVERRRLERMKSLLRDGERIADATYASGFGSSRGAYTAARRLGMTPARYARGGAGEEVRYAIVPTPAGMALIAATARGVCAASLGEGRAALFEALRREFPQATLRPAAPRDRVATWARAFVRHLASGAPLDGVPLDLRGTEFQRRVWQALREIPFGTRCTYTQIAKAIGRPKAVRAVASACAANRVAIAVPCHRVFRTDGGAAGYRWGVARKRRLEAIEGGGKG